MSRLKRARNIQEFVAISCVVALNNPARQKLARLQKRLQELDGHSICICIFCKDVLDEDDAESCDDCERGRICPGCMKQCTDCDDKVCRECISFCEYKDCQAQCCPDCIKTCERCYSSRSSYCWSHATQADCCVEPSSNSE